VTVPPALWGGSTPSLYFSVFFASGFTSWIGNEHYNTPNSQYNTQLVKIMSSLSMPDNVKAVISRLSVQDQVVIRSYIAGMRDELKELKVKLEHADDDPHAHYHGHEVSR
jgi:hypothetical protein